MGEKRKQHFKHEKTFSHIDSTVLYGRLHIFITINVCAGCWGGTRKIIWLNGWAAGINGIWLCNALQPVALLFRGAGTSTSKDNVSCIKKASLKRFHFDDYFLIVAFTTGRHNCTTCRIARASEVGFNFQLARTSHLARFAICRNLHCESLWQQRLLKFMAVN